MEEALAVTYRLTLRDFAALIRYLHDSRPSTRVYELIGSGVIALKMWLLARQFWRLPDDRSILVAAAAFVIFFAVLTPLEVGMAKLFDVLCCGSRSAHLVVVSRAGLLKEGRPLRGLHPWAGVDPAATADHLFFTLYSFSTLVIPKKVFPQPADAMRFYLAAVGYQQSSHRDRARSDAEREPPGST